MADLRKHSSTSNIVRFKLTKSSDGTAFTGASSASSGLIISTICDNEATATAYTVAGSTIETITTLGTFAAPTATKCRFKEVDATNHAGLYEFQFADARYSVASAKRLVISVSGITGLFSADYEIQLIQADVYDATRMGLTALPNAAADAAGGLPISDTGGLDLDAQLGTKIDEILDDTGTTGVLLSTTALGAIWNRLTSSLTTVGSIGKWILDNLTGDIYARLGAPAGASVSADIAAVKAETATIVVDTNELQTDWANGGRLDLILDARASQTSVDDIPTNAELATALATGVNVTQIDGSNLGTHGIGQFPADVRDWGGLGAMIAIDADVSYPSVAAMHVHEDAISAAAVSAAAVTKIQNGLATASELLFVKDRVSYCLTVLVGACSDAGTSAETYVHAIGGETFTVDYTGLDLTGNRTTTTLSKV